MRNESRTETVDRVASMWLEAPRTNVNTLYNKLDKGDKELFLASLLTVTMTGVVAGEHRNKGE